MAIQEKLNGSAVEWMEQVTDAHTNSPEAGHDRKSVLNNSAKRNVGKGIVSSSFPPAEPFRHNDTVLETKRK